MIRPDRQPLIARLEHIDIIIGRAFRRARLHAHSQLHVVDAVKPLQVLRQSPRVVDCAALEREAPSDVTGLRVFVAMHRYRARPTFKQSDPNHAVVYALRRQVRSTRHIAARRVKIGDAIDQLVECVETYIAPDIFVDDRLNFVCRQHLRSIEVDAPKREFQALGLRRLGRRFALDLRRTRRLVFGYLLRHALSLHCLLSTAHLRTRIIAAVRRRITHSRHQHRR